MSNLQTRRLLFLFLIASLSLGLFLLVAGPAHAAQTVTSTPGGADTAAVAGTPAASDTAAATDTPVPAGTPAPPATAGTVETSTTSATPEAQNGIWSAPVNLSQSGAASAPVMAAEANGDLHVLWWDKFDGTKYAFFTRDKGWSKPVTVNSIIGTRASTLNAAPVAPSHLKLFVDSSHELHAFWIDGKGNLLYAQSRAGSASSWTAGLQLATSPLAWDVTLDSARALHVLYIRPANNPQLPSGVYYRISNNGGQLWENVQPIIESPYFRTMDPALAHVSVASNGTGSVLVSWDDPQLKRSFFAQSQDGGKTFGNPVKLLAADALQNDSVESTQFYALSSGQFLRLWQAGSSCILYQQQSDDKVDQWSVPMRVLQNLGGCPQDIDALAMPGNQLFANINLGGTSTGGLLTVWDGQTWLPPQSPRLSFVSPVTNRATGLECVNATLVGSKVALIGCDDNLDIWFVVSLKDVIQMLPALNTAWNPPLILSRSAGDADLPAVAAESDGRMHALWGQTSPDNGPGGALTYSRGDGVNWTAPADVLSSPHGGKAEAPAMVADRSGSLHAVWSGGFGGEVYYSHAFIRDAASANGWSSPALLPAPLQAGSSPALVTDSNGGLAAIYAIPLNEARGVYFTQSTDEGNTWSAPKVIFDAAAAGWAMVSDVHLVIDSDNHLHATWVQSALPPATTHLGLYYSRSDDGGQTWTEPLQISGVDTGFAVMAASAPNEIHLLWSADLSGQTQLWHQWSTDDGVTWTKGAPIIGQHNVAPRADLATDGAGSLYLVGVQQTADDSAALFYLHWDGNLWTDRESLPLGFTADNASGARAIILSNGNLGVFYRVRAPTGNGGGHYVLGYSQRPVQVSVATPVPTITAQPSATVAPSATAAATITAVPTPNLNVVNVKPLSRDDTLRIGAILIGMLVVVIVATIGLRLGQR